METLKQCNANARRLIMWMGVFALLFVALYLYPTKMPLTKQHILAIPTKVAFQPSMETSDIYDKWTPIYTPKESSFFISNSSKHALHFPLRNLVALSKATLDNFVFVTAASQGFYGHSIDAIATIQRHYPRKKIIFYDLASGSTDSQKRKDMESYCNVEYRSFPFSEFPEHISYLHNYAWKPLIIHMVLKEYDGVFWMDSSARMLSGNMTDAYSFVNGTGGVMLFNYAGANTFQVTHPTMYDYLPTNINKQKYTLQFEANIMLLYRTRTIYDDVIKWWVLCALTEPCISPTHLLHCTITDQFTFADCHRFDQSAINILLANKYKFNHSNFARQLERFEVIMRFSQGQETAEICSRG